MNEHDATEAAYRNGYKKGVEEKQSEVDALQNALDNTTKAFLRLHYAYQNQKAEIAREIFAEIESLKTIGLYGFRLYHKRDIAELKKKYTGG